MPAVRDCRAGRGGGLHARWKWSDRGRPYRPLPIGLRGHRAEALCFVPATLQAASDWFAGIQVAAVADPVLCAGDLQAAGEGDFVRQVERLMAWALQ